MMRIDLNGVKFLGDEGRTRFSIEPESFEGWLTGGVGVRRDKPDRPDTHGAFLMPGYRTGRTISWSGLIHARSDSDYEHAIEELSGLLNEGQAGRLQVQNAAGNRWAEVVLDDGGLDISPLRYGAYARYRIQMWASDPRIYGEQRSFSGSSVQAFHYGNASAPPVVTIRGASAGGYTLTGPNGGRVVVTKPLVSGTPHVIDFRSATPRRGGLAGVGGLTEWNPIMIPRGAPSTVAVSGGSVTLDVEVRDTFI